MDSKQTILQNFLKKAQQKPENTPKKPTHEPQEVELGNGIKLVVPKGETGDKGDNPIKGKDYFTDEEIQQFVTAATPVYKQDYLTDDELNSIKQEILEAATPQKGVDYDDGAPGDPGVSPDPNEILRIVLSQIPEPIPGEPGKDGRNPKPKEVIEEIRKLKGNDRLDISNIRNSEQITSALAGVSTLHKRINNLDERWHGGGISAISLNGTSVTTGATAINFTGAGVSSVTADGLGVVTVTISGGGSSGLVVGTTTISGGTNGYFLYDNNGVLGEIAPSGTGTVTTVSVTTANGVSGTVANPTTTPAITLTLGAITPTSVNSVVISGSSTPTLAVTGTTTVSGSNTGDQTITLTGHVTGSGTGSFPTSSASKFILQGTTDSTVSAAQFLGALTTGIVKNTTTTGVLSIAIASDFPTLNQNTTGNAATATALATGRTISITGDLAYTSPSFDGSGNITAAGTLATVNSNVGSFGSATQSVQITLNGKGLATAASNVTITPAVGSITGLGTGIATFLATPSSANLAAAITDETGSGALVFAISPTLTTAVLGSSTATTQTPADNSTKVATTAYVDAAVLGQNFKEAALVATTANLIGVYVSGVFTYTATGTDTIDGVTLALGNRVLVKNQTTTFQNGIYAVTTAGALGVAGVLTRSSDANTSGEFKTGDSIFVTSGTVNASTTWAYTGADSPTIGTDPITYAQTAGQGTVTAGNGITVTGLSVAINTSVTVDKTTAQVVTNKDLTSGTNTFPTFTAAAGTLTGTTLNSTVVTSSLTSVGTIATGVWNGTIITGTYLNVGANLSAGTNITFSGSGTSASPLVINASGGGGGGITWNDVTGTTQAMVANNGYISDNASLVTMTLPTTAALGTILSVSGNAAGGWKIAQNASQNIKFGSKTTTTGTGGSLASTLQYDAISILCTVANTTWVVQSAQGNITVV